MKEIEKVACALEGTSVYEVLQKMGEGYEKIEKQQKLWYEKSCFNCPEGCGCCCHNFEPDLLEVEALYMAAWLLENKREIAEKVLEGEFPFENGTTCLFHDFENPYHCTIYGGRPSVCRLFGASGAKTKNGETGWKPCKFIPLEALQRHDPPISHRQYSAKETEALFGTLPPAMSDLMEGIVNIEPGNLQTEPLRKCLPKALAKIKWLMQIQ